VRSETNFTLHIPKIHRIESEIHPNFSEIRPIQLGPNFFPKRIPKPCLRYSFDLEDLLRASTEVLGKGGLGTSYKAVLEDGATMVVKRMRDVAAARREFAAYVEAAAEQRNLVPLRGTTTPRMRSCSSSITSANTRLTSTLVCLFCDE
jgi:hypothetical protein